MPLKKLFVFHPEEKNPLIGGKFGLKCGKNTQMLEI